MLRTPALIAASLLVAIATGGVAYADQEKKEEGNGIVRYNLSQLVAMARQSYPGVAAARYAVEQMEAKLYRAKWAWVPQGTVTGLVAPAPEVRCMPSEEQCIETTAYELNSLDIAGVHLRIELSFGMPLYTFDKLGAAKRAAEAGVDLRRSQVASTVDKLALDVTKAYWGVKLAEELLYTIDEGREHLVKAKEKVEEQVDEGDGEATLEDLHKINLAFVEIDGKRLQAVKMERFARAALATLTGQRGKNFKLDKKYLAALPGKLRPAAVYKELASNHRPDHRSLKAAMRAAEAQVDLEKAQFFPNFMLVGSAGAGYASSADEPKNAYMSDPFNFLGAGFGLALRWNWDQVQQYGKYKEAKAQLKMARAKRAEAVAGINLELDKALLDLQDAQDQLELAERGAKIARQMLTTVSQNMAAGLNSTDDFKDGLTEFFKNEVNRLQACYQVNIAWADLGRIIGIRAPREE